MDGPQIQPKLLSKKHEFRLSGKQKVWSLKKCNFKQTQISKQQNWSGPFKWLTQLLQSEKKSLFYKTRRERFSYLSIWIVCQLPDQKIVRHKLQTELETQPILDLDTSAISKNMLTRMGSKKITTKMFYFKQNHQKLPKLPQEASSFNTIVHEEYEALKP